MGNATHTAGKIAGTTCTRDSAGTVTEITDRYQVLEPFGASAATALGASGLPAAGAAHADYSTLFVDQVTPEQDPDGQRWVISVRYGKSAGGSGGVLRQTVVYGSWCSSEDLTADAVTGAPLLNLAGDPYDGTLVVPRKYPMWTITKEVSSLTKSSVMAMNGTVNNASVTMPCGTSLAKHCGYLECQISDLPGGKYQVVYQVQRRIHLVDLDGDGAVDIGWDEAILERGYFFLADGVTKLRFMETEVDPTTGAARLDPSGSPVVRPSGRPQLLDAFGDVGADPIFTRWATIPEATWSL